MDDASTIGGCSPAVWAGATIECRTVAAGRAYPPRAHGHGAARSPDIECPSGRGAGPLQETADEHTHRTGFVVAGRFRHRGVTRRVWSSHLDVRRRLVLARPRVVHLEPEDGRRPAADPGDARSDDAQRQAVELRDSGRRQRGQRCHRRLVHIRDRHRPRPRPSAADRRQGVDTADHIAGTQGLRREETREPRQGRRARRLSRIARAGSRHGRTKSARSASPSNPTWW